LCADTLCRPRNAGRFILSPGTIFSKKPRQYRGAFLCT